jgi:hypothetical protein
MVAPVRCLSTSLVSFENRFMSLPWGVRSKKSMGAFRTCENMLECNTLAAIVPNRADIRRYASCIAPFPMFQATYMPRKN